MADSWFLTAVISHFYSAVYITRNTVGRLIRNKSPLQMENIRVIDPACGSGTFLVRAYSTFLERHLKYYSDRVTGQQTSKGDL